MSEYIDTLTLVELADTINQELTAGCSFTQILPNTEIERITLRALNFWYQNYYYAVEKAYVYINKDLMLEDTVVKQKYIQLTNEVQNVTWLFQTTDRVALNLGVGQTNLSVGMGVVGNQPYLSSALSSLGEVALNSVSVQNFGDMIDQLRVFTIKHAYNFQTKRLNILTATTTNMIAECYVRVGQEYIFADAEFQEYATALCLKQMGLMLSRFNFNLQGGITIDGAAILAEGKERETAVLERIKNLANTSFMFMVKR